MHISLSHSPCPEHSISPDFPIQALIAGPINGGWLVPLTYAVVPVVRFTVAFAEAFTCKYAVLAVAFTIPVIVVLSDVFTLAFVPVLLDEYTVVFSTMFVVVLAERLAVLLADVLAGKLAVLFATEFVVVLAERLADLLADVLVVRLAVALSVDITRLDVLDADFPLAFTLETSARSIAVFADGPSVLEFEEWVIVLFALNVVPLDARWAPVSFDWG